MNLREFMRFHLFKVLLIIVGIQIAIVAVMQNYDHPPQAQPDQASMIEGRSVKITPLPNDFDKDPEDEIVLLSFTKPAHGTVDQKKDILYYTPEKGFAGADSFAYTISDGRKKSKSAWITIQVNKNLPPLANHDLFEVYCGGTTTIDVLKNDNDREGDSIFIKGYSQPRYGRLNWADNKLVYSSNSSSAVTDSFLYVINDGKSNSDSTVVSIAVKGKNDPCYPWLSGDVGDAAKPGSFSFVNNAFVIEASGSDIWNQSDGFRFAYQTVTGDCELYAKVEKVEGNNEWTKAGVMIRESLNGGSKCAFVCVTTKNGATYHHRIKTNERMQGGQSISTINAPYWVKITRKGNTISYFISANGHTWNNLGTVDVFMGKHVYIGIAVTSHNNNELCKAVLSNYRLKN